jgi:hypothetical protein
VQGATASLAFTATAASGLAAPGEGQLPAKKRHSRVSNIATNLLNTRTAVEHALEGLRHSFVLL